MAAVTALSLQPAPAPRCNAERLGREISQLCSYLYAAEAKLLALIHQFDVDACHAKLGFHSTAHWLNYQCGIGMNAARERVRVANALVELPKISAAFAAGTLSYSKVRALSRIADNANEDYLLMIGTYGTAHHVEKLVARYRRAVRLQDAERAEAVYESRTLSVHFDDDGALVLNGRFPAEQGAVILKAIEMASDLAFSGEPANDGAESDTADDRHHMPVDRRRADALANLSEAFLNHPDNAGNTADRYQVVVHVTEPALYDDAHPPAETNCGRCQPAEAIATDPGDQYNRFSNVANPPAETSRPQPGVALSDESRCESATVPDAIHSTAENCVIGEAQSISSNIGVFIRRAEPSGDRNPPAETLHEPPPESVAPGSVAPESVAPEAGTSDRCLPGRFSSQSGPDNPPAETPHIENGPHLTAEAARRIACDCSVVPIKENMFGELLAIGRKSRSIPPAIRRALQYRDGGCRFPGCTHTRFVDGHHIRHWADGGETSLDNLVLLCRHHHRAVHEGGFGCERSPGGKFVFTDARSRPISEGAPLPGLAGALDTWLDTLIFDSTIDKAVDDTIDNFVDYDRCRAKHGADERMDWELAVAALF